MDLGFLVNAIIGTFAILINYLYIIVNVTDNFPLPQKLKPSYINSPYWLGLSSRNAMTISILQIFALVSYVIWVVNISLYPPVNGIFSSVVWRLVALNLFLIPSSVWPYITYKFLVEPSLLFAILSSMCLWIAAIGVILAIAAAFENTETHPIVLLSTLIWGSVIILADGIGWTATAIYTSL